MSDERARELLKRHGDLESIRLPYEPMWREIAERVLPEYRAFSRGEKLMEGGKHNERVFDSTARLAADRCTSAIESVVVPRTQQWHKLKVTDESVKKSVHVQRWLDEVNRLMFAMRYSPKANFAAMAHEKLMSDVVFGTGCMFTDEVLGQGIRYTAIPLAEVYVGLDAWGKVDTVHRVFEYTARQAAQAWGEASLPEKIRKCLESDPNKKHEFLHCVKPNEERLTERGDYRGMRYASYYVAIADEHIVSEGGYRTMPYAVSRYATAPRETYGRSPAAMVLPDIKMVNEMEKTNLRILHRMGDPPLLLTEDGALSAFSTRPGALNPGGLDSNGNPAVVPLQTNGRPDLVEAKLDKSRKLINDAFLVTLFAILVENPGMTATEALIRAQEKGALLAPTVGRQQSEWLGVQIEREIDIMAHSGMLPPMPQELLDIGGEIDIEYVSPLNRAARAEDGIAIMNTIQSVMPVAQIDPSVLDVFDWPQTVRELADINGFPAKALKTVEQIQAEQAAKAQQAQAQAMLQAAPVAAQTAKTMAEAQAIAGSGA